MKCQPHHLVLLLLPLLLWAPEQLLASESIKILSSERPSHRHFAKLLQQKITTEALNSNRELRITIGAAALGQALRQKERTPVLALLITHNEFSSLTKDHPSPPPVSAIYREQPIQRLLNLTRIATPTIQSVALPIQENPLVPTPDTSLLTPHKTSDLRTVIKNILPTVDAVITHHSPLLYNAKSFKHLLLSSYRQQKALICHTQAMVTAGCIMGTYSTADQLIQESIDWITEYQQDATIEALLPPRYSSHFSIATNNKVARSLGHQLPNRALLLQQLITLEEDGL